MKATREAYGEELAKLVQENKKIVVLDADLAGSTKSIEGCPGEILRHGYCRTEYDRCSSRTCG